VYISEFAGQLPDDRQVGCGQEISRVVPSAKVTMNFFGAAEARPCKNMCSSAGYDDIRSDETPRAIRYSSGDCNERFAKSPSSS
jgi:hypothetical protein